MVTENFQATNSNDEASKEIYHVASKEQAIFTGKFADQLIYIAIATKQHIAAHFEVAEQNCQLSSYMDLQ